MDVFPFNADVLFLPFKLKANTTKLDSPVNMYVLFLPFKLKANTTVCVLSPSTRVVSTFQTKG